MEQYHIRFLVTKDGGEAGGFRRRPPPPWLRGWSWWSSAAPGTGARA